MCLYDRDRDRDFFRKELQERRRDGFGCMGRCHEAGPEVSCCAGHGKQDPDTERADRAGRQEAQEEPQRTGVWRLRFREDPLLLQTEPDAGKHLSCGTGSEGATKI